MMDIKKLLALFLPFLAVTLAVIFLSCTDYMEFNSIINAVGLASIVGLLVTGAYLCGLWVTTADPKHQMTTPQPPLGGTVDLALTQQ